MLQVIENTRFEALGSRLEFSAFRPSVPAVLPAPVPGIERLRAEVARLERGGREAPWPALPFGVGAIDARLPGGGLALGALHEISGLGPDEEDGAISAAFLAGILARLAPEKPVLWCQSAAAADLYGPGLAAAGLKSERLIVVRARNAEDLLWAMEEGLRSRALAAVVGELEDLPGPASRRLQLAAEASGVTGFALRRTWVNRDNKNYQTNPIALENKGKFSEATLQTRPISATLAPNAAVTRWRLASLPSAFTAEPGIGRPRWRAELWRCRGGAPAEWLVEACDATGSLSLSAALADRTAAGAIALGPAGRPGAIARQPAPGERVQYGGRGAGDFARPAAG